MSKKHVFLQFFLKIAIFACVFCTVSAWAETACDIDFTPIMGNSIQNGTPTPTAPVEIESVGTKVGNKYQLQVTAQGKNLFDVTKITNGYILGSGGGLSANSNYAVSDKIYLKAGTYTFSQVRNYTSTGDAFRVWSYDNNDTALTQLVNVTGTNCEKQTFTVSDNVGYIRISYRQMTSTNVQLEQGSVATSYEPYSSPITTNVYLDEPLRKVGDYADVLDYKNGQIIRNVGAKVFDGTEDWAIGGTARFYIDGQEFYNDWAKGFPEGDEPKLYCSHWPFSGHVRAGSESVSNTFNVWLASGNTCFLRFVPQTLGITTVAAWRSYIAAQYAAGTPVIVYYPLATPVVEQIENWSCTLPITDIKIATTKYVESEFALLDTALANAISVVDNVVTQTIAQAGQIATLQNTKQTRPDDDDECPAGKKCLLVTDETGTPHWYEIVEP